MLVNIQQMTQAMGKVSSLAENDSNAPGVLLKLRQGEMEVCYSNGRQAVTERIDVVQQDGDLFGEIVMPYQRLAAIMSILQPSGRISTSDITMRTETPDKMDGVMEIDATKFLVMYRTDGEVEQGNATGMGTGEGEPGQEEQDDGPREDFDSAEFMAESARQFSLGGAQAAGPNSVPGQVTLVGQDGAEVAGAGAQESEDNYTEETCTVSQFHQKVAYADPKASTLKYGLLTRMNYDDIFVGDDGETNQDFDVWDIRELTDLLNRMALEKNRTIYASHSEGAVFVVNIAYASWVATNSVQNNGFTVTTNLAKSVVDILRSMERGGVKQVLVKTKDKRYVNMTDTEHRVGLWYEMVVPSRTDAATLTHYRNKDYRGYRVLFSRDALENVLASAMATDKVEKTTISFTVKDSSVAMRIESTNSGASVSNVFDVISYGDTLGFDVMLKDKLVISLKTLSDMVKNCTQDFVELAVDIPEDGGADRFVRLGDVVFGEGGYKPADSQLCAAHYTVATKG